MPSPINQKLQEEIQALEHELTHALPQELKRARALGDLSENAEYQMAKQRQDYVGARLAQLKKRLADLSLLDRKSTRLNSSHSQISYAVFCLKKKKKML